MDNLETKLITVLRRLISATAVQLEQKRKDGVAWGNEPEWPWSGFILSFATFGGSDNWDNTIKPRYEEFSWRTLENAADHVRAARFAELPNPNRRHIAQSALAAAFDRFKKAGGPDAIRQEYEALTTAEERIAFLKTFKGIGNKYARNIPMDRHDDLVRDHLALDHRLKLILTTLGHTKGSYRKKEAELRRIANLVPCDGWTLDRVLFAHHKEILTELGIDPDARTASKRGKTSAASSVQVAAGR